MCVGDHWWTESSFFEREPACIFLGFSGVLRGWNPNTDDLREAQEHETWLGFNVLWAKATILLHCLIKFINWIWVSFITPDSYWFHLWGDTWWCGRGYVCGCDMMENMKNRTVYGVFCCFIVLPYGFKVVLSYGCDGRDIWETDMLYSLCHF